MRPPFHPQDFVYGRFPVSAAANAQALPPALERHRAELAAFHAACFELACTVLDAFSVAMHLPRTYFRDRHAQRTNGLSMINYPAILPEQEAEAAGAARASAHKDWCVRGGGSRQAGNETGRASGG